MTKISVCGTLYFRNHISYDLHLWYTYMYKRIISRGRKNGPKWQKIKGQKMAQNDKKFCLSVAPHLRNHTSHDADFWYTCVKWCLQQIFSFFKILILGFFKGGKMAKNDIRLTISGTVDHITEILIMISTGIFVYFIFFKYNIVNIKIILFFIGPPQQFFK